MFAPHNFYSRPTMKRVCARIGKFGMNRRRGAVLGRLAGKIVSNSCAICSSWPIRLLVALTKFLGPGGARRVVAESLLLKHQLLISNRSRQRAPNLTMLDRLVLGLTTLLVSPHRIPKLSAIIKPATLFKFHKALVHRKYRLLFSSSHRKRKPGPKGPSTQLIAAIIE